MTTERFELDNEAWTWVVRKDGGRWTAADETALNVWLEADPRRPGALLEAEAFWAMFGGADHDIVQAARDPAEVDIAMPRFLTRRRLVTGGSVALAASLAGGVLLLRPTTYATKVGEIRRVPLDDGSVIAINTASKVEIRLADSRRRVRIDAGEAWFQVAKDKHRPFTVEAGPVRVRAVGTAFAVRRRDTGAEVLITEGVVETWTDGGNHAPVRLTAGQSAFVADDARIAPKAAAIDTVDRALAWRRGNVDFVNQPIVDAIAELNRYNRRKLVLIDTSIAQQRFDGLFRTDDPEALATAIRDSLGVPIDTSSPDEIRIG